MASMDHSQSFTDRPGSIPLLPRSSELQCFTWSRVHPHITTTPSTKPNSLLIPPPRSGAASVVVQGRLYVFGGYGGGTGRLDDFYSFDFLTGTWSLVPVQSTERPCCRENNGVVISDSSSGSSQSTNTVMYLFGGYNGQQWLNDLWVSDYK
jgi:Kelch motif